MKFIRKNNQATVFEKWKTLASPDWQPTYRDLRGAEKDDLRNSLLAEQGWVCCYCGISIDESDSHIEHFRPQHGENGRQDLQIEYNNLHISCMASPPPNYPTHCGHAKGDRFDEQKFISPLENGCETRFIYTFSGKVTCSVEGDVEAEYMIDLLSLNSPILEESRKEIINAVLDEDFLRTADLDDFAKLRDAYRQQGANGRLMSFGHVIARYLDQLLGNSHQ